MSNKKKFAINFVLIATSLIVTGVSATYIEKNESIKTQEQNIHLKMKLDSIKKKRNLTYDGCIDLSKGDIKQEMRSLECFKYPGKRLFILGEDVNSNYDLAREFSIPDADDEYNSSVVVLNRMRLDKPMTLLIQPASKYDGFMMRSIRVEVLPTNEVVSIPFINPENKVR